MAMLSSIQNEREEHCRFDDFRRYAQHLNRKLHTLRKSTDKKQQLLLYSAERAWSKAMMNKSMRGKTQESLNKLRKACKHASAITKLVEGQSPDLRLQAVTYEDYLRALLEQEHGNYDAAIVHYSRALIVLQNRGFPLLIDAIETGLRFSIYQSGAEERSINLQRYALEHVIHNTAQTEWRVLIDEADITALKEEKADEMITSIEWAGRSANLTNSELVSSISAAVSGRATLKDVHSIDDFDRILAAWASASDILDSLLEKEEDQSTAQNLEVIKAWLSFSSMSDRVARDKVLVSTIPPHEGLVLCQSIAKTYMHILELPGLSEEDQKHVETQQHELRGECYVLLASIHGSTLESIALLNHALSYFQASSTRQKTISRLLARIHAKYTLDSDKKVWFNSHKWWAGNVKQLGGSDRSDLRVSHLTTKPVVFDIAWNYILDSEASPAVAPQASKTEQPVTKKEKADERKGFFGGMFGSR